MYVFRSSSGKWTGPHTFISISGDTSVIENGRGERVFRSICLRPAVSSVLKKDRVDGSTDEDVSKLVDFTEADNDFSEAPDGLMASTKNDDTNTDMTTSGKNKNVNGVLDQSRKD